MHWPYHYVGELPQDVYDVLVRMITEEQQRD